MPSPPLSPGARPGLGRYCFLIAGDDAMLYQQVALRLALDGYHVTGVGPPSSNAQLKRAIHDLGGTFEGQAIAEIVAGSGLVILEAGTPYHPLTWSAKHRLHIQPDHHHSPSPGWRSALITYPAALLQDVMADLVEQVTYLLICPPCTHTVHYRSADEAFERVVVHSQDSACPVSQVTQLPLAGVQVRSTRLGSGVLTTRAFRAGEQVMAGRGVRLDHQTEHSLQLGPAEHLEPQFPVRYINHSCEPNLGVKTNAQGLPDFYALRDLAPGEEVYFDYAMTEWCHVPRSDPALEFSLECRCKAPSCRGTLGYYSTLPPELKQRYAGFVSAYLLPLDEGQEQQRR